MDKIDIRQAFPVLDGGDGLILSKRGDVALGWELTLPPALRTSESSYDSIIGALRSAVSLLPDYTVVHKMDFFFGRTFRWEDGVSGRDSRSGANPSDEPQAHSGTPSRSPDFLTLCERRHFEGRHYMDHRSYLFLTFCSRSSLRSSGSGLLGMGASPRLPSGKDLSAVGASSSRFEAILSDCPHLSLRRLSREDIFGGEGEAGIIQRYLNFNLGQCPDTLSDISLSPSRILIGDDKAVCCHMVCDLEDIPGELSSARKVDALGTEHSRVVESFLGEVGVNLGCDHVLNCVIVKDRSSDIEASLSRKARLMRSMSLRSNSNRIYGEETDRYLDEVASGRATTVRFHMSILSCGDPAGLGEVKDKVVAAVTRMGLTPVLDAYDAPAVMWACIPGNEPGLGPDALMTMELTPALCMGLYEGQERGICGGSLVLTDRLRSVPVPFDIGERAFGEGLIGNYNVFLLGPSGSGKSFLMNKYLHSCYRGGAHCFLIDVGDSYRALSGIIREESGGKDGTYYTFEKGRPLSFNPFRHRERFRGNDDNRSLEFLYTLMCTLWKGGGPVDGSGATPVPDPMTPTELKFVGDSIDLFLGGWNAPRDPVFDDYYDFLGGTFASVLQAQDVGREYFDLRDYLFALGRFHRGGPYGYLLNSPDSVDILSDRFVVFEIDRIKDDHVIYPITTLVIMDAFLEKMTSVPAFKVMCIEEAWKAVMGTRMATYMMELWKTARKHRTSAVVVTQELSDITSSPIIRETIIENSAVKILLDQSKFMARFDELGNVLALGEDDKALVLSLNRRPSPYGGREAFFSLGNRRSYVWRVEVSEEEMVAFSSGKKDRELLGEKVARCGGSYVRAIGNIVHPGTWPEEDVAGPAPQPPSPPAAVSKGGPAARTWKGRTYYRRSPSVSYNPLTGKASHEVLVPGEDPGGKGG